MFSKKIDKNKQNQLLQISLHEFYNDLILPVYQGGFIVLEMNMLEY